MKYKITIKRRFTEDEETKFYQDMEDLVKNHLHYILYFNGDINIYIMERYIHHDHPYVASIVNRIYNERHRRIWAKRKYTFRRGPVPLIRCSRGGNGSYRSPRTKQELSQEEPTRLSRRSIPTSWDDVYRDTQRSWKKYRRTQWK